MLSQKGFNLTNEEIQLLLSLYFGDGFFYKQGIISDYSMYTNCIHKDYLEYKQFLIKNLNSSEITYKKNPGFKKTGMIYKWHLNVNKEISKIFLLPFSEKLDLLDELGLAMWFYDDGSLHKKNLFYNLCTHSFSIEDQELILKRLLDFGIKGKILKEVKKDGRVFFYININKYNGAYIISKIMNKINIESMAYKLWNAEANENWCRNQNEWNNNENISFRKFSMFHNQSRSLKGKKHRS